MYKFVNSINEAIDQCKWSGKGEVKLNDEEKTIIHAEWEEMENDNNYDVITLYFYQNNRIVLRMEIEETKVKI